jgi:hypothetical protein
MRKVSPIILLALIAGLLILILLTNVGLIEITPDRDQDTDKDVYRFVDDDAGVVCWVYNSSYEEAGGISCVALKDTLLYQTHESASR